MQIDYKDCINKKMKKIRNVDRIVEKPQLYEIFTIGRTTPMAVLRENLVRVSLG